LPWRQSKEASLWSPWSKSAREDYIKGKCYVTSQCHNYALENDFGDDIFITHININDNTVEGFKHKHHPVLGVQYHPKAILDRMIHLTYLMNLLK